MSGSTEKGDGVPEPRSIGHVRQLSMSDCMDLLDDKKIDYGDLVELAELQDKIIEHLNIREDDNDGLQHQRSWTHTPSEIIDAMVAADEQRKKSIHEIYLEYESFLWTMDNPHGTDNMDAVHLKELAGEIDLEFSKKYIKKQKISLMSKDCPIVVAGEVGAGKSTFLNLLIGSKILPSSLLACTSVICLLRNSNRKGYRVMETGSGQPTDTWFDGDATPDKLHAKLQDIICKKDRNVSNCCQVDIHWPIPILKGHVIIVDTPGIGESPEMNKRVKEYLPNALSFIYIVNTPNAGGTQSDRLMSILDVQSPFESSFDPRNAIFICNKWDQVKEHEQKIVYTHVKKRLKKCWPYFQEEQLFTLSATSEIRRRSSDLPYTQDFRKVMIKIEELVKECMEMKSTLHILGIDHRLKRLHHHITSRINNTRLNEDDKKRKMKNIQKRLEKLREDSENEQKRLMATAEEKNNELSNSLHEFLHAEDTFAELKNFRGVELPSHEQDFDIIEHQANAIIQDRIKLKISEWCTCANIQEETEKLMNEMKEKFQLLDDDCQEIEQFIFQPSSNVVYSPGNQSNERKGVPLFNLREKVALGITLPLWVPLMAVALFLAIPFAAGIHVRDVLDEKHKTLAYKKDKQKLMQELTTKALLTFTLAYSKKTLTDMFLSGYKESLERLFTEGIQHLIGKNEELVKNIQLDMRDTCKIRRQFNPMKRQVEDIIGLSLYVKLKHFEQANEIRKQPSNITFGDKLGEGAQAVVYKGKMKEGENEVDVAIKKSRLSLGKNSYYDILSEVENLNSFGKQDNIVSFYGIIFSGNPPNEHVQVITELCEQTIEDMVMGEGATMQPCSDFSENALNNQPAYATFLDIVIGICKGLIYIHKKNFVHRDLKLSNVLMKNGVAKIADLGCLKERDLVSQTLTGTPSHMAPEVLMGKICDNEVDIYSFGILLWEFWYGMRAFENTRIRNYLELKEHVAAGKRPDFNIDTKTSPPSWLQSLIVTCWDGRPKNRPNADECYQIFQEIQDNL